MIPRLEGALGQRGLGTLADAYVALAGLVMIASLWSGGTRPSPVLATLLFAPVVLAYAQRAGSAGAIAVRAFYERRAQADIRQALAGLGSEYRILSRQRISPGREDHIAVGPNGIFVVLSCYEHGRVTASDHRLFVNARPAWRDMLDDCRVDSVRVRERVRRTVGRPLPVYAIVSFSRALVAVGQEILGVRIVHVSRLRRLVASTMTPVPLTLAEIEAAVAALTERKQRGRLILIRPRAGRRRSIQGRSLSQHHQGAS